MVSITLITRYRYCLGLALIALFPYAGSTSPSPSVPKPTLYLPMGSYLGHFNIGGIYFDEGYLFVKQTLRSNKLSFESTGDIDTPESCVKNNFDLAKGNGDYLVCDTSVKRSHENAARFFYSILPPFGSYLKNCIGVLRTREGEDNTKYLYASCVDYEGIYSLFHDQYTSKKINISGCEENDIVYSEGQLKCSREPIKQRRILSGSYLKSCNLTETTYDPDARMLITHCPGRPGPLLNTNLCIGDGKDIALREVTSTDDSDDSEDSYRTELVCEDNADSSVTEHISSPTLPAGNYLSTCRDQVYFPCLGSSGGSRQGVLAAKCADRLGDYKETHLSDQKTGCRMSDMGYVSNIDGELKCDPDITFEDEDPTDGSGLQRNLQCLTP